MRPNWFLALAACVPFALASHEYSVLARDGGDDKPPPKDGGCLRSCFNDKPACPKGMDAQKLRPQKRAVFRAEPTAVGPRAATGAALAP
ncbi:uncharacterized protein DSM5745_05003 [Aspergillus mulundensis]|uniref:Uncharacterized protein n=1 Tax=Aspergillus mulundensis TaxID=1810919 RepID=A0A3D8S5C2_9EURO|nr:hypothetical protein DSM5745_05003 [Aspergillus mulundensis]RDW81446.1 hypothetical protein DSM5745_05003 [Aspergillus mulundensis]